MKKQRSVSHSKLQAFQDCETLARHKYVRKVYPRARPLYYVFGEAAHKFLEIYYSSRGDEERAKIEAIKIFDAVDRGPLTADDIHKLEIEQAKLEGICEAYPKFYTQDFDEFPTMLVELDYPETNGFFLASTRDYDLYYEGKIDGLFQDAAGDWWIVEHKFLAPQSVTQGLIDKIHIDNQILGYMWLAKEKAIGKWPKGVLYNIIKKPAIRQKKGETLRAFATRVKNEYLVHGQQKNYFMRFDPMISLQHLEEWKAERAHVAGMMYTKIGIKSKVWSKNTGTCNNLYGNCPYLSACVTGKYNRLMYEKSKKRKSESSTQETKEGKKGKAKD